MTQIDSETGELPRLLADFDRPPGVLKLVPDDFEVDEIPLYPASGIGTHTYALIEKRGMATRQAVHILAEHLGVRRRDIGFAGLKDARAVTRQWISVEHVEPDRLRGLTISGLSVLEVTRHGNKLRIGHLRGNRFRIRVRHSQTGRLAELQDALARLARRGVPNYFGPQRFGSRGDTWQVGRALIRNELEEAVDLILGRAVPGDRSLTGKARRLYDAKDYRHALRAWPPSFRAERHALRVLAASNGNRRRAFSAIDEASRRFYVSSYQSELFNRAIAARLPLGLDRLLPGDLAWVHASGAVFRVADAAAEQPRADAFEISPSGPIFGYRMTQAEGEQARIEALLLEQESVTFDDFKRNPLRIKGMRRAMRFRPESAQVRLGADGRGPYLELEFVLPAGCYATTLLRELFDVQQVGDDEADEGDPGESPEA